MNWASSGSDSSRSFSYWITYIHRDLYIHRGIFLPHCFKHTNLSCSFYPPGVTVTARLHTDSSKHASLFLAACITSHAALGEGNIRTTYYYFVNEMKSESSVLVRIKTCERPAVLVGFQISGSQPFICLLDLSGRIRWVQAPFLDVFSELSPLE